MVTISQKKKKKSLIFYWYYKKINSLNFPSPLIVIILKKKKKFTDCINDRIIIKEGDNIIFGIYKSVYCILKILFQLYV